MSSYRIFLITNYTGIDKELGYASLLKSDHFLYRTIISLFTGNNRLLSADRNQFVSGRLNIH